MAGRTAIVPATHFCAAAMLNGLTRTAAARSLRRAEPGDTEVVVALLSNLIGTLQSVGQSRLGVFIVKVEDLDQIDRAADLGEIIRPSDIGLLILWIDHHGHIFGCEPAPIASEHAQSSDTQTTHFEAALHATEC